MKMQKKVAHFPKKVLHIFYRMEPNVENGAIAQGNARNSIYDKNQEEFLIIS